MKICLILKCLGNFLCVCMFDCNYFQFLYLSHFLSFSSLLLLFSFFLSTLFVPSFLLLLSFSPTPPSFSLFSLSLPSLSPSLPLSPHSVCMVSCVTKEGIRDLQDRIHAAALNAKDPDTHEHVIGMQVQCMCVVHIKRHYYRTVLGLCASLLCVCVCMCVVHIITEQYWSNVQ